MDQETARALFNEGAFLLLFDVPEGTEFGIDWNNWTTGPLFKGVKMIPPGVHFVFYNAVSKFDGNPAPRTGFFHDFRPHEIMVKQWNNSSEEIVDKPMTEEEISSLRQNLQNLDKNLAAYPYDNLKKWVSMANFITPNLVQKLSPENKVIYSVLELLPHSEVDSDMSSHASKTDKDGLPNMKANPMSVIRFTNMPDKWYPEGASPSDISKHCMDSSYILDIVMKTYNHPNEFLGELQFTFICFILGQVFDAFEHWKEMVRLISFCETSLQDHLSLFSSLVGVLYHQINEIPQDFFVDIVTANNFLVGTLTTLFSSIEFSCFDEDLQKRAKQFRKYLTKKFKWKFNKEPDDWAPVVVEM
ncbi:protein AAR2 homolog [Clavelina lepadiformis]|uniref:Protein AAR2 homolog n=1 Tax=Clavelina lepadiformis TaxID=159417 RepID=A0ABP0FVW1_CLALP